MDNNSKKPGPSESLERIENQRRSLIKEKLYAMATAIDQPVSPERIDLYCDGLRDLSAAATAHALDRALRNLGGFLPSIAQLRGWAEEFVPEAPTASIFKSVSDIDPEKCPKGWTPDDVWRAQQTMAKIRGSARRPVEYSDDPISLSDLRNIAPQYRMEQIKEWMEAGKEAQNEHIAKLHDDPQWLEMAKRLGGLPGLTPLPIPSEVPSDPTERAPWASLTAKKQGWL